MSPDTGILQICESLGVHPSEHQVQALLNYLSLLQRWNATYNLTAVRDPSAMLTQHLADCLAVVPRLAQHYSMGRVLDVGSGGGLPGAVLAIMLPALDVTCVDTVGKKVAFIRQVAGNLGLRNLHAIHGRVQDLKVPSFDLITSRAFASLSDFVSWTHSRLAPGGVWVAMKGKTPTDEILAVPAAVHVFHVEPLAVPGLDAERCLVWMRPQINP